MCRVAVCGCGAIGSQVTVALSHIPDIEFMLIDDDRVEEHNLSTTAFDRRHVGHLKVYALESILAWSGIPSVTFNTTMENLGFVVDWGADVILDCFDNNRSRIITRWPCTLHAGVGDTGTASVEWDRHWRPGPVTPRGSNPVCTHQQGAWILGLCAQFMAVAAMSFMIEGEHLSFPLITKDGTVHRRR